MKEVSWTFVDGNTQEIYCKRCGAREHLPLPMPVTAFVKFCDYFNEKHRGCIDKMKCTFGGHENYTVCPVCNGKKK